MLTRFATISFQLAASRNAPSQQQPVLLST
jgi:hypothetical protein